MSKKPIIFLSHAHFDAPIANALTMEIEKVFSDKVKVFNTSRPREIPIGQNFLREIENHIDQADVFIVLVTPASINNHWVWFELGAFWLKLHDDNGLYPLLVGLPIEKIPQPLSQLQLQPIDNANKLKLFFEELISQLGNGDLTLLEANSINQQIEKHRPTYLKHDSDSDTIETESSYSSPLEGYSSETLREYLDDFLFNQYLVFKNRHPLSGLIGIMTLFDNMANPRTGNTIFGGKILQFEELDMKLRLPIGTSAQHLKEVARNYGLVPISGREYKDSIRFKYNDKLDIYKEDETT